MGTSAFDGLIFAFCCSCVCFSQRKISRMDGNGNGNGNAAALKDAQQARWKTSDLLVLIAAKRFEAERSSFGKSRDKLRLAEHRWKEVEAFCGREGVHRKAGQCKKRWEKLMTDFKKVYDYQKQISRGQLGYFEQSSDERKKRKLPLSFLHEWYESMVVWVPNHRAINLDPDQAMENGGEEGPNLGSQLTALLDGRRGHTG